MQPCRSTHRKAVRLLSLSVAVVISASLAGCAHSKMTTGSISRDGGRPVDQMSAAELQTAGGSLGKAYVSNPDDKPTALRYATVLQMNGVEPDHIFFDKFTPAVR